MFLLGPRIRHRPLLIAWAIETARRISEAARGSQEPTPPDPDDLSALVVEHGESIYRVALSVVRDKALAEDVAQDTLVKAWLALPTFRGESSLKSWVLRIARNTAISTIRANRAIATDPFTLPDEETSVARSVERKVENREAMHDFVTALGELDDLSRSVVVLREIEGLSYDEIAGVLEVPLSTVKTRLMRARKRLGSALEEWAP
ncbi:MAG: RNA polymerase sigma factor [Acidimicrobiales bacterium]|nr:RNA polymerase sigma factor [Acidimicrobiales bacterium]